MLGCACLTDAKHDKQLHKDAVAMVVKTEKKCFKLQNCNVNGNHKEFYFHKRAFLGAFRKFLIIHQNFSGK